MEKQCLLEKSVNTEHGKIVYFSNIISKDKPTVLLLHGLSSNHTTWLKTIDRLSTLDLNIIAPDLRGHGHSDKTRSRKLYSLHRLRKDILSILDKEGVKDVHIIGYSWGGNISIDYAIAYPEMVKSLILISTSHRDYFAYGRFPFLGSVARGFLTCLGYVLWWQKRANYHYFKQGEAKGYWSSTFTGLATMPLSVNFWMLAEVLRINFDRTLELIKSPTMILRGDRDTFITEKEIEDMKNKIRNSEVINMKNSSHFLASHYQDDVNEHLVNFLSKSI